MNQTTPSRYNTVAILLHWLIGFAILGMIAFGWFMTDIPKEAAKADQFDLFNLGIMTWQLAEPVSPRAFYFNLHKSIGVTILLLVALRLVWRILHQPPALPAGMKALDVKLAKGGHHLLYLLMFAMPISGVLTSTYSKYGIKWFGIPLIQGMDDKALTEQFGEIHEFIGTLMLVMIALHVAGAIKHTLADKQFIKRMSLFG